MKQKLKNYLKLGILLFGIPLLLTNCERDDSFFDVQNIDTASSTNVIYFSRNSVPKNVMGKLNKSVSKHFEQKSSSNKDLSTSFGTILTDRIMSSVNEDGIENYTFTVELDDNDTKTFYNLVLRKNADGTFSEPYLKKYTMTDTFYNDYANGTLNINSFEGTYENYNIDDTIDIDILLGKSSRSSSPCIVPIDTTDDGDIGDGDLGDPVDGNNDTSGSGGGGGGSGTGTGSGTGSGGGGSTVTCTQKLVANICNGGGGHYGDSSCTGSFQGSIQLITTCSDGYVDIQDLKSSRSGGCPNDDGDVGVLDDDIPPCKKFKKLENNTEFKSKLQELKNKANTDDFETAYKMNSSGIDGFDYGDPIEGEPDELEIEYNFAEDEQIDGFIHNHYNSDNNNDLSVFSPADLYSLYITLKNDHIKNRGSFIYVVTTSQGTTYALNIKSKSKFIAFGNAYLNGLENGSNDFTNFIYGGKDDLFKGGIKNGNSNALNEKHFAKMLHFGGGQGDTGLELYKSDDNFENWEEIEYNPNTNTVSPNGC